MDENSTSGMMDVFRPATGVPPPALEHAVELYKLTHGILSPKAKNKLCSYFQAVADVVAPLKEKKFFGLKSIQKLTKPATPYLAPSEVCAYFAQIDLNFFFSPAKVGVIEKELFDLYILIWIEDKRSYLLETCDADKNDQWEGMLQEKLVISLIDKVEEGHKSKEELTSTMNRLHEILDRAVFISTYREYWDEMGQDVLRFLEDWKDNRAWYRLRFQDVHPA
nr:hypothetical protein [Tanacetum cinerariifolium]